MSGLDKIGIWEDNGEIAALATYDTESIESGAYRFPHSKKYAYLLGDMLTYAKEQVDGILETAIRDGDEEFQEAAAKA